MQNASQYGQPMSATATHATAAVASLAAVEGKRYIIGDISVSSDKAGSVLLLKRGTTVLWQLIIGAGNFEHHFECPPPSVNNELVSVEIDGTSKCTANINAYLV